MKFHKPLFSIAVILIQLIFSIMDYYDLQEARKANPELFDLISIRITYDSLFLFVLIIGFYEMLIKPSILKTIIRIFLVCIVLGTHFSGLIPINDFYYGVYNTAWFSALIAFILILWIIIKNADEKWKKKKTSS